MDFASSLRTHRGAAILQAILVTLLWSSSYILIKIGLLELPPLTFASLRYFLAFLTLVFFQRLRRGETLPKRLNSRNWGALVGLGLTLYALVPAAMFLALSLMPVVTVNLVFQAGIPILVALLSGFVLAEPTSRLQWGGVVLTVIGIYLFFPARPQGAEVIGIALAAVTAAGVAASNLLTRFLMRDRTLSAPQVSMISMGIGSSLLLVISLASETWPSFSWTSVLILAWLALVNTALAFTLWNRVLRTLTALEGGVIANAQIVEVAIMAWIVLGERMELPRILAALLILAGVTLVQARASIGPGSVPRDRRIEGQSLMPIRIIPTRSEPSPDPTSFVAMDRNGFQAVAGARASTIANEAAPADRERPGID